MENLAVGDYIIYSGEYIRFGYEDPPVYKITGVTYLYNNPEKLYHLCRLDGDILKSTSEPYSVAELTNWSYEHMNINTLTTMRLNDFISAEVFTRLVQCLKQ